MTHPSPQRPKITANVGIFGASGTSGTELAGLLQHHGAMSLRFATSRSYAGRSLRDVDPAAPPIALTDPAEVDPSTVDLVFCCLPHGDAALVVARCLDAGTRVVDLSGDFRLHAPALHAKIYGTPRAEAVAVRAVYGLTELNRAAISAATVVANPGCYPTCVAIGLAPLVARDWVRGPVIIDAKSGVSGAGRSATPGTHFLAVHDDVRPYKLGRGHRHVAEIEQTLTGLVPDSALSPVIIFNPHVVPIERGMLATMVVHLPERPIAVVREALAAFYEHEPLIEVLEEGPARIRAVCRTNRAQIGVDEVEGTPYVVVTSTIDNLGKGAAGQALQNANLMLGLPETQGLGVPAAQPVGVTS